MPSTSVARSISGKPKFSIEKTFPWTDERQLFLDVFCANKGWDYIYKPLDDSWSWKTGQGKNGEHWQLRPSEIFKAIACQHSRFYFGMRSALHTKFAAFDIDKNSQYHNKQALHRMLEILTDAGLERHALYQSSDSGGWYLYIYFDDPHPTREVRSALVKLFTAHGFQIKRGQLEIFPDAGALGSEGFGLRLPLQPGFAWMNSRTLEVSEYREDLSPSDALHNLVLDIYDGHEDADYQRFLRYVANLTTTKDGIQASLKQAFANVFPLCPGQSKDSPKTLQRSLDEDIATVIEIFGYVPPGMIASAWVRGRDFSYEGLTDFGQRHEASKDRHHYYFYGDPSLRIPALGYNHKREREVLVNADLYRLHNGFSKEINRGSLVASREIANMADWEPARRKQLLEQTQPASKHHLPLLVLALANVKRSSAARVRIAKAVERLIIEGAFLSRDTVAQAAKCSPNTAKKHADLWKPLQTKQWNERLAGGSGDLKLCVAEGEPQKAPPQAATSLEIPGGRLAARQLIFEFKMRDERDRKKKAKKERSALEIQERSWHLELEQCLPSSFQTADTFSLQFLEGMCRAYLPTSPDYESQKWLQGIQEEIRLELKERWQAPDTMPPLEDCSEGGPSWDCPRVAGLYDTG